MASRFSAPKIAVLHVNKKVKLEEAEAVRELPILPRDVVYEVLQLLPTHIAFRLALTSRSLFVSALGLLKRMNFTSFRNEGNNFLSRLSWIARVGRYAKELKVVDLVLIGPATPEELVELLCLSPWLERFSIEDAPCSDLLRSTLSNHSALHTVELHKLKSQSFGLIEALPTQLTRLTVSSLNATRSPGFFQKFVSTCPNLTSLSISSVLPRSLEFMEPLTQLQHLDHLSVILHGSDFPLRAPNYLQLICSMLPTPRNNRWLSLRLGSFDLARVFADNRENIPLLREVVQHGMYPNRNSLALHPYLLDNMGVQAQETYYKFLLEEHQLVPVPCQCREIDSCEHCRWFRCIVLLKPPFRDHIIEHYFLPFVDAKAKLLFPHEDLAAIVTSLLALSYPQSDDVLRRYLLCFPTLPKLHQLLPSVHAAAQAHDRATGLYLQACRGSIEGDISLVPLDLDRQEARCSEAGWEPYIFQVSGGEAASRTEANPFDEDTNLRYVCLPFPMAIIRPPRRYASHSLDF